MSTLAFGKLWWAFVTFVTHQAISWLINKTLFIRCACRHSKIKEYTANTTKKCPNTYRLHCKSETYSKTYCATLPLSKAPKPVTAVWLLQLPHCGCSPLLPGERSEWNIVFRQWMVNVLLLSHHFIWSGGSLWTGPCSECSVTLLCVFSIKCWCQVSRMSLEDCLQHPTCLFILVLRLGGILCLFRCSYM